MTDVNADANADANAEANAKDDEGKPDFPPLLAVGELKGGSLDSDIASRLQTCTILAIC
jgi:hypothetical protein